MPRPPPIFFNKFFRTIEPARNSAHHKQCEFGGRFRQHISSIGERNAILISRRAIYVVYADGYLRHYAQIVTACCENFFVNLIAQSRDERVNSASHFFNDERLRRRLNA